jgi:hypothetical protein
MKYWFYTILATWRLLTGRWFVWRDAPTPVVRRAAVLWRWARHEEDDHHKTLIWQAHQEYKLRKKK